MTEEPAEFYTIHYTDSDAPEWTGTDIRAAFTYIRACMVPDHAIVITDRIGRAIYAGSAADVAEQIAEDETEEGTDPNPTDPRPLRILVACETSGAVREAFRDAGHDAWSVDILPSDDDSPYHIIGDAIETAYGQPWDMMIAHPPCTYLASSGLHWNTRIPGRREKTEEALQFVRALMDAPIPHIAIENPVGRIGSAIRPADQYIQPYEFGHDASKRTGLWLKNLPPLTPTMPIAPRIVNGRPRWSNQTDSGQNRLSPSPDRWKHRSATYIGIARAMADQWGRRETD